MSPTSWMPSLQTLRRRHDLLLLRKAQRGLDGCAGAQSRQSAATFYCYGTEDPFYSQFEAQYDLMQEVGVTTKRIVLQDWPHGFGGDGGWVEDYARWLEQVFSLD